MLSTLVVPMTCFGSSKLMRGSWAVREARASKETMTPG